MSFGSLLIANRGEIAIRIARAAAELDLVWTALASEDDAAALHARRADRIERLPGRGPAAYLAADAVIAAARRAGCQAIHPGYGFLAENAAFAEACAAAGLTFIGPSPAALRLFGDKAAARRHATQHGVPVLPGTDGAAGLEAAEALLRDLGPGGGIMLKAVVGGGGRGMRVVEDSADLAAAFARCASEAERAFGDGAVYAEALVRRARHIEIQVIGDGTGAVSHLGERECTLQRRHQKLVEFAPSAGLAPATRRALCDAAVAMASACGYAGLGTFEFLIDADDGARFWFIETNPRVQVEHTVTEAVTGLDLVQAQIRIAQGATLAKLGLAQDQIPQPRGVAVQLRLNMETLDASGAVQASAGTLSDYELPSGPGVRVDGCGYVGYATNPAFDSLLAKLVFTAADHRRLIDKAARGLAECRVAGVRTNLALLKALLAHPAVREDALTTRFIEAEAPALAAAAKAFEADDDPADAALAVSVPPGCEAVAAPMAGTLGALDVGLGEMVRAGQVVAILESMKMEHTIEAPFGGIVRGIAAEPGAALPEGAPILFLEPAEVAAASDAGEAAATDAVSPALAEVIERHDRLTDARRPEAVARRRKSGQRTIRESLDALCDPGSFVEYGGLAVAAQRARRSVEELIASTPADGIVTGIGQVNGQAFGPQQGRCMVLGYDYTVLAGTQGSVGHHKLDRMLAVADKEALPVVLFAEGGGGRSGDTDRSVVAALETASFARMARLSGRVPLVGIVSGYCFAGNAALLGCCDVIIAAADASLGMAGPAMIEGGGLGIVAPQDVGPVAVQVPNGVIDIAVADEVEAVDVARRYLSYFQGRLADWDCDDQAALRQVIPDNRLRVYDVRRVIAGLADHGSVLELRPAFGVGLITALARIEGRPVGIIANNPRHLSGAIDSPGADKGARFLRLCDLFGLPVVSLCDTPGFMVGPESEKTAAVRHVSRMFVTGANLSVPLITVVLRKAYGLGAMAMAAGGFHEPVLAVAWPSGEFGGMGLEGQVRLGRRRELEAIEDPEAREALFRSLVAQSYERGKALNTATHFEIDDVIDPADTRAVISRTLDACAPRSGPRATYLDTW